MGCPECSRLSNLFSVAIRKHGELRDKGVANLKVANLKQEDRIAAQAVERELEVSTAEIGSLRRQLLAHEATHRDPWPIPSNEGQSSNA